eukprot:CAMPEP_0171090778 /NCGR_PEP_ID=MMETSP0766_2-20121228/32058_1 /TAXON_ID=439317 /ORGANISM="Gambierdiscus australes, Strain CAWD 149" /LENGTH=30 /DNA_ID= /DNA_START= /DNA_END= /DNA_ORIENTATION=
MSGPVLCLAYLCALALQVVAGAQMMSQPSE